MVGVRACHYSRLVVKNELVTRHHSLLGYQLALRTPGIIPDSASSRKQMRQRPKRRRYARDRPQRAQRLCFRTGNFGFRFAFSIMDFGGTN